MTPTPPLLAVSTLQRVLRLAKFDGTGVLIIAGAFALSAAAMGNRSGALIGIAIAGAGAFELHGVSLLAGGKKRGMNWLVGSQLYLLGAVLAYVAWRLSNYDPVAIRHLLEPALRSAEMQAKLRETGATEDDVMRAMQTLYHLMYLAVGLVTVLYQGGLARYYHRRRTAVTAALADEQNIA